jgi:adenosylmethionine-8-amino-7-oxononanoate aminotransferase
MQNSNWAMRDLQHIWHPCSQMKDYETFPPMLISKARGAYIELANGHRLIDAISSWWCKSLGHGHPRLRLALQKQAEKFEHAIFANLTHEPAVLLAEQLAKLTPSLNKVMFAGDGSSAVEIAMKMSLHARNLLGENERNRFMALSGAYHGETCAALAASDLSLYNKPYEKLLPQVHFLQNIPYVSGREDPLWQDCSILWPAIERQLEACENTLTAILVEPLVQGAVGMRIYSADFLKRLRAWTQDRGIHLIADEIMTGLGRTGLALACDYANIEPDILCLGKGLTAGWLPLSAVLTSTKMYQLFYDDYETGKAFLHSHTYSGNALAIAVGVETLKILQEEKIYEKARAMEAKLKHNMQEIADNTGYLKNIRSLGAIVAADVVCDSSVPRVGYEIFKRAVKLGALLRPIGNTIYWLPPLNCEESVLTDLKNITATAIHQFVVSERIIA